MITDTEFNPFTGELDFVTPLYFRGVLATAPSNPTNGWTYINSGDHGYYIYYGSTWQLLHTLVAADSTIYNTDGQTIFNTDGDTITHT